MYQLIELVIILRVACHQNLYCLVYKNHQ